MTLTEDSVIDLISVTENNNIEIRRANRIYRDGIEISRTYHRYVLQPGDDLTDQDPKVVAIATTIWNI